MPFREKSAWISVLSMSVIYGFYFFGVISRGTHAAKTGFTGILGTIVALVIVQVALTIAAAVLTPKEAGAPPDERDKVIDLRAIRFAYFGLATAVAMACLFGAFDPPLIFNPNALLFILVTAEIMRCGCQIVQYRRGA